MMDEITNWLEESKWFWIIIFGSLLFLSVDFWNWSSAGTLGSFLPLWLLRLIVLQFILALAIGSFTKFYWRE